MVNPLQSPGFRESMAFPGPWIPVKLVQIPNPGDLFIFVLIYRSKNLNIFLFNPSADDSK